MQLECKAGHSSMLLLNKSQRVVTLFNLSGKNRFIQQKNVHKSQKKQSRFKNQSIFKFLLFICSVGNNTFLKKISSPGWPHHP